MDNFAQTQWRCRRGTLELDAILEHYLENRYQSADVGEKRAFAQLLEFQDGDLLAFILGARRPVSPQIAALVDKIRNLPAL
jgi:antitoxin CptB